MQEQIICNKEDLVAIADAVRASNGSTETYNVPELSVAAIEAIGSGTGGGVQPDWDAGENELGHILNRTHYTETVEGVILDNAYSDTTMQGLFVIAQPLASNLTLGSSYHVIYNGTSYNCVCSEVELFGIKGLGLGNTQYIGGPLQTAHPFAFVAIPDDMVESFGLYGGVLALDGASNITISILGVSEVIHKIDNKYINFPNSFLRNGSSIGSLRGTFATAEGEEYKMGQQSFAIGFGTKASNYNTFASGCDTEASGWGSHAEGYHTKASGDESHTEGYVTEASGDYSHAEGYNTKASEENSHAEGCGTEALGNASHAEGWGTTASGGRGSHAEGLETKALGNASHAEGDSTEASGSSSHAEGCYTKASSKFSHVQGKWNIEDIQEKYAHIVGNGTTDSKRSNAHTLDWEGNAWYAGNVYIGGTSQDDSSKVLTEAEAGTIINTALAEAKASGEFKGEPGPTGPEGKQGPQGEPGKDANVTSENIASALGYTPAKQEDVSRLSEKIEVIENEGYVTYINLFDKTKLRTGGLYNGSKWSAGNYTASAPIYLTAGDYLITNRYDVYAGNALKAYKVHEDGEPTGYATENGTVLSDGVVCVTIPEDDFWAFNICKSTSTSTTVDNYMLVSGSNLDDWPPEYVPYGEPLKVEKRPDASFDSNPLYEKTAVFDGDSICAGVGWAGRIANKNKMTYSNQAVGGGTITSGTSASHWVSTNLDAIHAAYPNLDYLILEGGTNDADILGAEGLGTLSSSKVLPADFDPTADFTQAMEYMCSKAIALFPTAQIGFIVAHKMGTVNDYSASTRRKFFDRAAEVCKKYGIPVLDLWNSCHLHPMIDKASHGDTYYMYTDGQHLSDAGYEYITPIIEAWMKTI